MIHELAVERTFHIARGRRHRKGLCVGEAPPEEAHRIPRIARLVVLAIRFDHLIASGQVVNQAELALLGRVSRARLTQILNFVLLAPEIQEELLFLSCGSFERSPLHRRQLQPIAAMLDWQRAARKIESVQSRSQSLWPSVRNRARCALTRRK